MLDPDPAFRPIRIHGGYPPLADLGLIGDGATAALVGLDGSIRWMCVPSFDSEPLFCALLDHAGGGEFSVAPERLVEARQRFDGDLVHAHHAHHFLGDIGLLRHIRAPGRHGDLHHLARALDFEAETVEEMLGLGARHLEAVHVGHLDVHDGEADVVDETYARSALGALAPGHRVNLERPVRLSDRLGGHLVQGHVDGVGTIVDPAPDLRIACDRSLLRYIVEKGSITIDGISLTVVEPLPDGFTVAVIPHTQEVTTLGQKGPGDPVNLEVDVIAKYVEKFTQSKEDVA